jgi:hypothetical protein
MKHRITLDQAKRMTKHFRNEREKVIKDEFRGKKMLPTCETFEREAFEQLLRQPGCTHIRIYLGMDEEKQVKVIAVGANEKGEDILPTDNELTSDFGVLVEEGQRCPDYCPPNSELNYDTL